MCWTSCYSHCLPFCGTTHTQKYDVRLEKIIISCVYFRTRIFICTVHIALKEPRARAALAASAPAARAVMVMSWPQATFNFSISSVLMEGGQHKEPPHICAAPCQLTRFSRFMLVSDRVRIKKKNRTVCGKSAQKKPSEQRNTAGLTHQSND